MRSIPAAAAVIVIAMFALATWFHFWRGNIPVTSAGSAHRWLYLMPLTRVGDFALGILAARAYVLLRGIIAPCAPGAGSRASPPSPSSA